MGQNLGFRIESPRSKAQQAGVVTICAGDASFVPGLRRTTAEPRDHGKGTWFGSGPGRDTFCGALQHGPIEAVLRITNTKLRGMNPHREPTRPRIQIVADECALPPAIPVAVAVESQRKGGDHLAREQM